MTETALTAFATFFATIGPLEAAILFAALGAHYAQAERRAIALRAVGIATLILLFFAVTGRPLLTQLGVTFPALQAAGGVILLVIALDMIFARPAGPMSMTPAETVEAGRKEDITVFPLATPLLAGPGAMSAAMLMMAKVEGDLARQAVVLGALLGVMGLTLALFLLAERVQKVIMRVFGILLAAIAVQSLFDGIAASGLLARA